MIPIQKEVHLQSKPHYNQEALEKKASAAFAKSVSVPLQITPS